MKAALIVIALFVGCAVCVNLLPDQDPEVERARAARRAAEEKKKELAEEAEKNLWRLRSSEVEPDAVLGPNIDPKLLDELVSMILTTGFRCDSISHARMLAFSRGYAVSCNLYAYQYLIKDRGGTWIVTLD